MAADIQYGMTKKDREQMLRVHNFSRKQVNVAPLVWDDTLAKYAAEYGKACIWGHWSQNRSEKLPQPCFQENGSNVDPVKYVKSIASGQCPNGSAPPGENLGMGVPTIEQRCHPRCIRSAKNGCGEDKPGQFCPCEGGSKGGCAAINWYNEIHDYNCGKPINAGDCREQMCGHYTQMVSSLSKRVGCAAVRCPSLQNLSIPSGVGGENGSDFVICEYFPHGNIVGEIPFSPSQCSNLKPGLPLDDDYDDESEEPESKDDDGKDDEKKKNNDNKKEKNEKSPAAAATNNNGNGVAPNGNNNGIGYLIPKSRQPTKQPISEEEKRRRNMVAAAENLQKINVNSYSVPGAAPPPLVGGEK